MKISKFGWLAMFGMSVVAANTINKTIQTLARKPLRKRKMDSFFGGLGISFGNHISEALWPKRSTENNPYYESYIARKAKQTPTESNLKGNVEDGQNKES